MNYILYKLTRLKQYLFLGKFLKYPLFYLDQCRHLSNFYLLLKDKSRIYFNDGDTAMQVFAEIFSKKEYGNIYLKKGAVVLDIGANIGVFTHYIKRIAKDATVFCFEPDPKNFNCLSKNLDFNRYDHVTLINKAVSDNDDSNLSFFCHPIGGWSSLFNTHIDDMIEIKVPTVKLSQFLKDENISKIDLMKIDVEGGEYAILCNDLNFEEIYIYKILVEIDKTPRDKRFVFEDLIAKLNKFYSIEYLNKNTEYPTILATRKK